MGLEAIDVRVVLLQVRCGNKPTEVGGEMRRPGALTGRKRKCGADRFPGISVLGTWQVAEIEVLAFGGLRLNPG